MEGDRRPRSFANRLVVWPFATPRKTCISREVSATDAAWERGTDSDTRRNTSGIIRRGTGLSLRNAASKACCSSVGPTSLSTYPAQPACIILKRSSLESDTVQATILVSGNLARTTLTVVGPSITGMCTSMSTRSGFRRSIAPIASDPEDASPTNRSADADASIARAAVRGTMLSSTTKTRYFL